MRRTMSMSSLRLCLLQLCLSYITIARAIVPWMRQGGQLNSLATAEQINYSTFVQYAGPVSHFFGTTIFITLMLLALHQFNQRSKGKEQLVAYKDDSARGMKFVFLSTVGFSLASVGVKLDRQPTGVSFPTIEIALIRAIIGFTFAIAGLKYYQLPLVPKYPLSTLQIALARGVLDFIASNLFYYACSSLPIALATIIYFTNPFWASILAKVLLGEPYDWKSFSILCLGSLGTFVALWPELGNMGSVLPVSGLLCAALGSVFQASQYVAGRALAGRGMHWLYQNMAYSVAGMCLGPVALSLLGNMGVRAQTFVNPLAWDAAEWATTVGVVACALISQVCLILGTAIVPATKIAVIRALDIPMAMLWAAALLHVLPNAYQVGGGGLLVIACGLLVKAV